MGEATMGEGTMGDATIGEDIMGEDIIGDCYKSKVNKQDFLQVFQFKVAGQEWIQDEFKTPTKPIATNTPWKKS